MKTCEIKSTVYVYMSFSAALSQDDNIGHLCIGEQNPMVLPFKFFTLVIRTETVNDTSSNDGTTPKALSRVESTLP